jgi:hypothetical protein
MPRKPDLTVPKRPVGRPKGSTKLALQQQQMRMEVEAAGLPLPPVVPKKVNLAPYPDLSMAIVMLRHRLATVGPQRKDLIESWLGQIEDIHANIVKLRKLEILSESLTSKGSKPKF